MQRNDSGTAVLARVAHEAEGVAAAGLLGEGTLADAVAGAVTAQTLVVATWTRTTMMGRRLHSLYTCVFS